MADFNLYSYSFSSTQLKNAFDKAPKAPIVTPPETPKETVIDININATANTVSNSNPGIDTYIKGTLTTAYDSTVNKDVLTFDGTGGGVVRFGPYTDVLGDLSDSMSIEAYFKISEAPANGQLSYIVGGHQSGGLALYVYGAGNGDNSNKLVFSFHKGIDYVPIGVTYTVGTYYHVVATFDGSNFKLYVNGELVGTTAMTEYSTCKEAGQCFEYIWLGADTARNGDCEKSTFVGSIAEFKVYNYGLTQTQVTAAYNAVK